MQFNDLSGVIIGCAIEVHKQLGAGLLEAVSHLRVCRFQPWINIENYYTTWFFFLRTNMP